MTLELQNHQEMKIYIEQRPWGSYSLLCANIKLDGQALEFKVLEMEPEQLLGPTRFDTSHYFYLLDGKDVIAYRGNYRTSDLRLDSMVRYGLLERGANIIIPKNYAGALENKNVEKSNVLEFSFVPRNGNRSMYADLGVDENCLTLKVLDVNPECKLSVQSHSHRGEFWYVLQGEVAAYRGQKYDSVEDTIEHLEKQMLGVAENVLLPVGVVHSLENVGRETARVLELSFGRYDENDIERYADRYGRT